MKDSLIKLGIFAVGAAIGAFGSKVYFEKKYKKIADEEIQAVKDIFKKEPVKADKEEAVEETNTEDIEKFSYSSKTSSEAIDYKDYYSGKDKEGGDILSEIETASPVEEEQYEIGIDDYVNDNEYIKQTLAYYT